MTLCEQDGKEGKQILKDVCGTFSDSFLQHGGAGHRSLLGRDTLAKGGWFRWHRGRSHISFAGV